MTNRSRALFSILGALSLNFVLQPATPAQAADELTPAEARRHVGEHATVCGRVESARYLVDLPGRPTFLDLGKPYPAQIVTVVIRGQDRGKFGSPPEVQYRHRRICTTGEITSHEGMLQMVVEEPEKIELRPAVTLDSSTRPSCRPRAECCRVCSKGKACGNSCISTRYTCHKGRGCACDAWDICG